MKYFLIAGERSGDQHGANLIRAIAKMDNDATFVGIGGDAMEQAGMDLLIHYRSMSYMGVIEVLRHLPAVLRNMRDAKRLVREYSPDVLVLIDFAAFNMKIARYAHSLGLKTAYYISPKVWAWNEKRVGSIKKYIHQLYCILPFEVDFFRERGYTASYVGNPVVEAVDIHVGRRLEIPTDKTVIGVLPGSRSHEVSRSIDVILQLAELRPSWYFLIAGVTNLPAGLYEPLKGNDNIGVIFERTYDVLGASDAAVVTSGTATLETALIGTPQVVCYRTSGLTYFLGRRLIKVPYISLVNLIAGEEVVKELIQDDYNAENVAVELDAIVTTGRGRDQLLSGYEKLRNVLGEQSASETTARRVVSLARR